MTAVAALHELGLGPNEIKALRTKAKARGKSAPEYVRGLIEQDLLSDQSIDDILRPIREGFRRSGVTPDELNALVTKARKEIYQRNARKRKSAKK